MWYILILLFYCLLYVMFSFDQILIWVFHIDFILTGKLLENTPGLIANENLGLLSQFVQCMFRKDLWNLAWHPESPESPQLWPQLNINRVTIFFSLSAFNTTFTRFFGLIYICCNICWFYYFFTCLILCFLLIKYQFGFFTSSEITENLLKLLEVS